MEENWEEMSEPIKVGFMINYQKMSAIIERIVEETKEYDDAFPKRDLLKIWINVIFLIFVLACLSHSIFIVATCPFLFFYLFVLFRLYGAWKRFKYPKGRFAILTILTVLVALTLGFAMQGLIWG